MSRDASGNYTLPGVVNPVVSATPITITWGNSTLADIQTALTDSLDRNGRGSMLTPLKLTDGTAALPSLTFANDTNTGIYRIGADSIGFSTGATLRFSIDATTGLVSTLPYVAPLGAVGAPGFSFVGDLNTGIYSPGADSIGFSTGATLRFSIDATTGLVSTLPYVAPLGAVGAPSLTFAGDLNTGVYSPGADQLAFATAGVQRWSVNSTGTHIFAAPSSGNTVTAAVVAGGLPFVATMPAATNTRALSGTGSTTGGQWIQLDNASGQVICGVDNSSGGLLGTGTAAYSAVFGTGLAQSAHVVTNGVVRTTWSSTGNTTFAAPSSGDCVTINGAALTPTSTQAFSATPTFNADLSNYFEMGAMTANVTSVTITNPTGGQTITIRFKQDATGGRTVATPAGAKISGSVGATASASSLLTLTYSTADARWEGSYLTLPA